jgi:hypothetical protein
LLAGISDPFLHAAAQVALALTLPFAGDFDGALQEATVALQELRGQDEPVFTAIAALVAGFLDMALDRYDAALGHLREARDLAERVGGDWLAAGPRVHLGILDVLRGSLDEARALMEEALDRSLAARSTPYVTFCLAGYAWLAFADGDPERAARLEGAADGLRRRVGLRAWPNLRRLEADLVAQVRQVLGAGRFDQAFSAGSRLTQRQAVAIARDQPAPAPARPEPLPAITRKPRLAARCAGEPKPDVHDRSSPPGQHGTPPGTTSVAGKTAALPPDHRARRDRAGTPPDPESRVWPRRLGRPAAGPYRSARYARFQHGSIWPPVTIRRFKRALWSLSVSVSFAVASAWYAAATHRAGCQLAKASWRPC